MMANYTMTIEEMMHNKLTKNIFPEHYEFYVDDKQAKKSFEDKFIKHYYYREIGFETPFMFTHKLETHLLINMPYWKQLYETELEAKNINFLLNKDLLETVKHDVKEEGTENQVGTSQTDGNSTQSNTLTSIIQGTNTNSGTTTTTATSEGTSANRESALRDGVAQSELSDGYLSSVSSGTTNGTDTSNSTQDLSNITESSQNDSQSITTSSNNSGHSQTESNNIRQISEETTLVSKGNIGVTSSAQLLKEWREVLINMDKIIIESCNDLFLKIY